MLLVLSNPMHYLRVRFTVPNAFSREFSRLLSQQRDILAMLWQRGCQQRVRVWGYDFEWTSRHQTGEEMRPLIYSYDNLATECLDRLDRFSSKQQRPTKGPADGHSKSPDSARRCLYEILQDHVADDDILKQLWTRVTTVPEWVDWEQIERGQQVFYRYAGPIVVALTFQSLLGGMGGRRVVETLTRTGGFGVQVSRRRLLETFQYILQVVRNVDSVKPGGDGFASSIRVRLLHASVRQRILQLARQKPEYYDISQYGIPINDLDSIGTITTFSSTVIWVGLPRQGIYMRPQEIADYIALWRWIAHLVGTPTDPFATPARAKTVMESLLASEIDPSPTSRTLANNIIAGLEHRPPTYPSADFLRAEAHWLNGRDLADALAVPRPGLFHLALVVGQCLFFACLCYLHRYVLPRSWEAARLVRVRSLLHRLVAEQTGSETASHEFQYIPNLDTPSTPPHEDKKGEGAANRGEVSGSSFRSWTAPWSVQRRNLGALVFAVVVLGIFACLGMNIVYHFPSLLGWVAG
ncbi:hypothetical protein VTK73DRAFT_86 [Phialemonium thermophilum]|uniref:ER-bound oxygenase mpaB/mpaB'/Rubber oxygenase catalytic domain-containing protein n=1 Tax=Phialemonium thermophilum TaxID=223376 RepID=A0ABR3Y960_9PEZI